MNQDAAFDPRRLGVPKEVVDEGARTLRHATQSLDAFVGSLTEGTAVEGMSPADAGWVSSSHHRHRTARSRLWTWAGWSTQLTLGNIFDHVQAIERTLVGKPVAIWSLVSLSRVVQEGAIRVCHLYELGLSPEQRAVRIAAAWLNGARQHQVAAKDVGVQAVPEAEKIWQLAERTVQRAGMSIGLDKRGHPNSAVLGPVTAPFKVDLTNIAAKRPTHLPAWYRISSAASHSTVWMVAQAFASDEDDQPVMRRSSPRRCWPFWERSRTWCRRWATTTARTPTKRSRVGPLPPEEQGPGSGPRRTLAPGRSLGVHLACQPRTEGAPCPDTGVWARSVSRQAAVHARFLYSK
ncbi:hypothetical protein [Streptomyces sp. NPDC052092]|uniref:hypothetical protein n=1 Tax=Streptomyces sp. NPDC052092 TaxID=3365685 RepID=UPI0037CFA144